MIDLREQWLAEKLGKFGAAHMSDLLTGGRRDMTPEELEIEKANKGKRKTVDVLFGKTAMTLINTKIGEILTGQQEEQLSGVKSLEWGEYYEYDAAQEYIERTGETITFHGCANPKFYLFNSFSGASPDAVGQDFNLELKCPIVSANHVARLRASFNKPTAQEWLKENEYEAYVQTQFAQMSCKFQRSVFMSYDPRMIRKEHRAAIFDIKPDKPLQDEIKYRLDEAGKIIRDTLKLLMQQPSVLIAEQQDGVTLISKA